MEQTRISSSPSPAAHEARGARGASATAGSAAEAKAAAQKALDKGLKKPEDARKILAR